MQLTDSLDPEHFQRCSIKFLAHHAVNPCTIRIQSRLDEERSEEIQERLHVLIDEEDGMGYGGQS